jgi:hypothetical protein
MICQILAGDPSPAVRRVAGDLRRFVKKLPDGSIRDSLEYVLADRGKRPMVKRINELRSKDKGYLTKIRQDMEGVLKREREERERLGRGSPNYEFYGPKPKKRVDG